MAKTPQRKRRAESFLGIHFDFHAGDENREIGKYTTPEMIGAMLDLVKPDYVQTDCKGHRGLSSYPTRVGNPAPGIVADALRTWRDETAKRGISLYLHYSGVWDTEAIRHHPEWAVLNADGKRDSDQTSTLGAYVDELLIPQLQELIDEYDVDGVWVDGDCWATKADYSPAILERYRNETGKDLVPPKAGQETPFEVREYFREAFRRYVRHYTDKLHAHRKTFQVASNWAFSSFMPEPVSVAIDYISGDYTLQNSLNSARLEGRAMARQGKPWDLMAWGFATKLFSGSPEGDDPAFCTKTATQMKQEAAQVLALGGGFQAYYTQRADGAIRPYQMQVMAQVAEFARERQAFCHKAQAIPQVAVLHSGWDYYHRNPNLFAPGNTLVALRGVLQALLDNQAAVEVLSEHHLRGKMAEYGLIVVPEVHSLEPAFREELIAYARAGGSLLLVGPQTAQLFEGLTGVRKQAERLGPLSCYLGLDKRMTGLSRVSLAQVQPARGTTVFGGLYKENDLSGEHTPAATLARLGKGRVGAIWFSFGERYHNGQTALARDFIGGLLSKLFAQPLVRVSGSHLVDVVFNRKDGCIAINLVNTGGPHANRDVYTYDEVPPLSGLEVRLRLDQKPARVSLQPGDRPLKWAYKKGEIIVQVPKVELHEIIWVEP